MFCRHCGQENNDSSIYCSNDGALLYKEKIKVNLIRDKIRFCKDCGKAIESYELYCTDCGVSLYEKREKATTIEIPNIKETKLFKERGNIIPKLNIKSSAIYSIIGFGIIFLLSIMVSTAINTTIQEQIMNEFYIPTDINLLSYLDVALILNVANLKLTMLADFYNLGTATLSGAPFAFILVPFIIFFLLGMNLGKKNNKLGETISMQGTLLTGLFYGLILALLALVNSAETSFYIPYLEESIALQKKYSFFTSLINGTLISTISLLLGYGVYWKLSKRDSLIGSFKWLFEALIIFLTSSVLVNIAAGLFIKFILKEDTSNVFLDFALFSQMGIYAFLMINLGSFSFMQDYDGETLSLFKNMEFLKSGLDDKAPIFLYGVILLPIILFYLYGKRSKENGNKNILYTTITYSIVIGILAYLTHGKLVGIGLEGILDDMLGTNLNLGFRVIYSIIGSLVLSTVSTLAGYLLSEETKKGVPNY